MKTQKQVKADVIKHHKALADRLRDKGQYRWIATNYPDYLSETSLREFAKSPREGTKNITVEMIEAAVTELEKRK